MKPNRKAWEKSRAGSAGAVLVVGAATAIVLVLAAWVILQGDLLRATEPSDSGTQNDGELLRMEVATVGLDMMTRSPIVLLREPNDGRTLPVWIGILEAQGIMRSLQGVEMPRPMTHDLMANLLKEMGGELVQVNIDDLRDSTYYGKLLLRVGDEEELRILDTRPSDGMALALRTGAPIHVANQIIEEAPDILFVPLDEGEQVVSTLGVTVIRPTPDHFAQFDLPDREGVLVVEVAGEARRRGLERGDLIIQAGDQPVKAPMEFFEAVQAVEPGGEIRLRYLRGETEKEIELPVEATPPPREPGRDVV